MSQEIEIVLWKYNLLKLTNEYLVWTSGWTRATMLNRGTAGGPMERQAGQDKWNVPELYLGDPL